MGADVTEPMADMFERVARDFIPSVRSYLLRRLPPAEADDVLSDVLVVMWRRRHSMPAGAEAAWSLGIARECLANARRTESRRRSLVECLVHLSPRDEEWEGPPLRDERVSRALSKVSPRDRELLLLWAWDDLTVGEIAIVLGTTPGTVSVRLHRAKQRLGAALGCTTHAVPAATAEGKHEASAP